MQLFLEWLVAGIIVVLGPLLTIFDLPGNSLMMLTSLGFAFYDEAKYFDMRLLSAMVLIYVLGEAWEFCVSLFGIKRYKVPWVAVLFIGVGGFFGTLIGTGFFPILGSFVGGVCGAFVTAFIYEYLRSGMRQDAWHLAWETAKMRFLALIGKMCAGIALAILLVKQIYLL
ncbi:MAG: DUF456 domain-containing protein [Phascolarctobacterium sp.]|nr:DUF456 domain-containing protein [Phascolarctobacterium sp.]MBR2071952.1 DUF456 domain-containing protein [Phascolarctobacterium sp.]MBR2219976.1 DUF456 domain-containing protein [Phascolarctobacterium sp.]MBR6679320.1 DUF456 domain-containing protein [Phascolarctobacterium sp.]